MGKKSFSREAAENKEDLPQVDNTVPESRMQQVQQIQDTDAAQEVKGATSSFQPKRSTAKGQALKQQVISEAITGSTSSAGMGISAAGRGVSGTGGGVLGANNSTPFAGKSRQDSRVGKKLDRVANKLNYTPCETTILAVDESRPLADAADLDQGYNGTYRNEFGRSQKIMGAVPADLMWQRSVDLISKDKLYFVEGQQIYQNDDDRLAFDPQRVIDPNLSTVKQVYTPTTIHSGNYLHRAVHFGLDSSGRVEYCYFDVDDITHGAVSAEEANVASAHRLIKSNIAELDRMTIDSKAGDEKADIWSPLARAIDEPTKWSYLMSSIEADTGAYCMLAYSKASTNMAYQLNRGPKDGLSIEIPAMEQFVGWRSTLDSSADFKTTGGGGRDSLKDLFDKANYRLGDPSLMIDAYDSKAKYNNKADLLLQPRGWRMHLQTADNNINALRVPTEFANVYAATECFSTIDREYDPLLPICMTDKANLITVHNLNELSAFYKGAGYLELKGKLSYTKIEDTDYEAEDVVLAKLAALKAMGWKKVYIYGKYTTGTGATDLDGIKFDTTTNYLYIDPDTNNVTDAPYAIALSPIELDTTTEGSKYEGYFLLTHSGFDGSIDVDDLKDDIIMAVPKVTATVTASTFEVDDALNDWRYLGCHELNYAYTDLRNNYIVTVKHPLVEGMIQYLNESIGGKIRSLIEQKDFMIPLVFSTQYMTLAQLFICAATPWIQRVRYNSMKDVIYYQDNVGQYPYSKLSAIKDAPFKNFVNFTYTDYDSPLETKVMNPVQAINWIMPEFFWKVANEKYVLPWYFCENDLNASDGCMDPDASTMCMPSIRSGIRLGSLDTLYGMSEKDIRLSLDRLTKTFLTDADISSFNAYKYGRMTDGQILANLSNGKIFSIGKILSAPRELGLVMDAPLGILTPDPADGVGLTTALKSLAVGGTAPSYRIKIWVNPNTIEHPVILNATGVNVNRAANYTQKWYEICANCATSNLDLAGLVFGLGDDAATYSPFADLGTGAPAGNGVNVTSYQRSVYTRLQLLPFIISPFDGINLSGKNHDIYDFAYYFGLCGFRASDYRESVYNREKEAINQGMLFVDDPWIIASPIMHGAAASTGLKETKGYEIK